MNTDLYRVKLCMLGFLIFSIAISSAPRDLIAADAPRGTQELILRSPVGGEQITSGKQIITWTSVNMALTDKISLLYSDNSGLIYGHFIAKKIDNTGSYDWDTALIPNGNAYRIKIISANNSLIVDISDTDFTINNPVLNPQADRSSPAQNPGDVYIVTGPSGYMNPFKGESATIYFRAGDTGSVDVSIYNTRGQLTWNRRTWTDGNEDKVTWDGIMNNGSYAGTGIYVVLIKGPGLTTIKKIALVK
jgi:hypothetical protein